MYFSSSGFLDAASVLNGASLCPHRHQNSSLFIHWIPYISIPSIYAKFRISNLRETDWKLECTPSRMQIYIYNPPPRTFNLGRAWASLVSCPPRARLPAWGGGVWGRDWSEPDCIDGSCVYVCMLPLAAIYRKFYMSVFKYFMKTLRYAYPAVASASMKGYCQNAASAWRKPKEQRRLKLMGEMPGKAIVESQLRMALLVLKNRH